MKFQFAKLKNVKFDECNACGCEFDLTHGNVEFMNCHMERCEFPNAEMDIKMIHCNSEGSEFNGGKFTFETAGSRLARAEFNESELSGTITECVCTNVEVNASVCSDFELKNCKTCGLEHENTIGFRNTEEALDSLLNADDDEELEEDFLTEDESDSNDDGKDSPLPF